MAPRFLKGVHGARACGLASRARWSGGRFRRKDFAMADIRPVTPRFAVAPQLSPQDMPAAAAAGFVLVVNNRPDGEAPGQPSGAEMQAAAEAAGLDYLAIPVRGAPTAEQALAVREAAEAADGPVLAFCRSGTRSIIAWAMGRAAAGDERDSVLQQAKAAGYDLSGAI